MINPTKVAAVCGLHLHHLSGELVEFDVHFLTELIRPFEGDEPSPQGGLEERGGFHTDDGERT